MKNDSFSEGLSVQYREMIGVIRFVCEKYLTLCIHTSSQEPSKDVCILIYRGDWNEIKLLKESDK